VPIKLSSYGTSHEQCKSSTVSSYVFHDYMNTERVGTRLDEKETPSFHLQ
jgi:hypothetical protein